MCKAVVTVRAILSLLFVLPGIYLHIVSSVSHISVHPTCFVKQLQPITVIWTCVIELAGPQGPLMLILYLFLHSSCRLEAQDPHQLLSLAAELVNH